MTTLHPCFAVDPHADARPASRALRVVHMRASAFYALPSHPYTALPLRVGASFPLRRILCVAVAPTCAAGYQYPVSRTPAHSLHRRCTPWRIYCTAVAFTAPVHLLHRRRIYCTAVAFTASVHLLHHRCIYCTVHLLHRAFTAPCAAVALR